MLILLIFGLISMLTACTGDIPTTQNTDSTTTEMAAPTDTSSQEEEVTEPSSTEPATVGSELDTTQPPDDGIILVVDGGWNEAERRLNEDFEYTLSDEDAEVIRDLFYSNEKNVFDSPLTNIVTFTFQISNDHLGAYWESFDCFSGVIDGEFVMVELTENECEMIRQIVARYHSDFQ